MRQKRRQEAAGTGAGGGAVSAIAPCTAALASHSPSGLNKAVGYPRATDGGTPRLKSQHQYFFSKYTESILRRTLSELPEPIEGGEGDKRHHRALPSRFYTKDREYYKFNRSFSLFIACLWKKKS